MKPNQPELEIINYIKATRIASGYKMINVSNGIGISESTYCKIETGKRPLSVERLIKIYAFLKISSGSLLLMIEKNFSY